MKKVVLTIILLLIPFTCLAEEFPELNSKNVYVYNLDTNEVLYEKNPDEKTLIASLTKVMTSIIAIENIKDLDEKVIITDEILSSLDNDVSLAGFKANETVTYRDLLYGALLPSGADATHSLAVFISGSEEEYVNLMNQKAKELGLENTHFSNSIGIDSEANDHYSTVKDFSKILMYALKNDDFKKMFSTQEYQTSDGNLKFKSTKKSAEKNSSLDLSVITGSKTGYTHAAGLCLASVSYDDDNANIIIVSTGADSSIKAGHFIDSKKLYDYYHNNYNYRTIVKKGFIIKKIATEYEQAVILKQKTTEKLYLNNEIDTTKLKYIYKGKTKLDKKVKKGDKIGKFYIYYNDEKLYEEDVLSPINVHFRLKTIHKIIIFTIVLYIFNLTLYNKTHKYVKKKKKLKRY